jgi:hypothetical protein
MFLKWHTYANEAAPEQKADDDYCPSTKTRLSLATRTSTPGEFLVVFEDSVREYQYHKFVAIWQTHQEQELKTLLLDAPSGEKRIIVDMDFAENYTIEHKVTPPPGQPDPSPLSLSLSPSLSHRKGLSL